VTVEPPLAVVVRVMVVNAGKGTVTVVVATSRLLPRSSAFWSAVSDIGVPTSWHAAWRGVRSRVVLRLGSQVS